MSYTRRRFLHTLVVSAGAVTLSSLTGCSNDDNSSTPAPENLPVVSPQYFPQSVMSGDPRPDSVILWTRAVDGDGDLSLTLQVSSDPEFATVVVEQAFIAAAANGHCIKVRVTDLEPYQHYYYRFLYSKDGALHSSKTGRTKTAPANDADVEVKFGFASCQDYLGRYYNTYLSLLARDDLDFVLHLGDYIYETTGDASFQDTDGERSIEFRDADGTLIIGTGEAAFQAANSVDNYRQLYETYRSDAVLQELHERFPLVAIWDDHEFSDDSWQTNATYQSGAADEEQTSRKRNAEQVYFEFMPIDHSAPHGDSGSGALEVLEDQLFPNTKIYRDLQFGKHLHLALTDYRTYRPDHLIPEDAFPASVAIDSTTLTAFLAGQGMPQAGIDATLAQMSPVVDIDAAPFAPYKAAFAEIFTGLYTEELMTRLGLDQATAVAQAGERASAAIQGLLTSSYLNLVLAQAQASLPDGHPLKALPPLPETGVDTGLAFYTLGKTTLFSDLGARYLVIKDSFDLYAGFLEFMAQQQGSSVQTPYDAAQLSWLQGVLNQSSATHKVMGSSVSFAPLLADLSASREDSGIADLEAVLDSDLVPAALKQRFYLNVDHWDGLPQFKAELINDLLSATGTVTLSGDIHASFVTQHPANANSGLASVDFTVSSVSSGTFGSFLDNGLNGLLAQLGDVPPEVSQLKYFFDTIALTASKRDDVSSKMVFSRMWEHGVGVATAGAGAFKVDYHNIPTVWDGVDWAKTPFYDDRVRFLAQVRTHRFSWDGASLTQLPA
ncbi:alkaline phosphatase D [Ferrimonas sediminum]|uniref:Alkaline phosphatase D n=1 Tax=Ferrimonas sediminum TaxID=718193 RepID=A0A1G8JJA5_9GAMM|nr:alkaline phosphatase D family protein [Ferrimonas sediminum]SDI31107.1 alkaline phosphatase D [Ferrimonas sediminum]